MEAGATRVRCKCMPSPPHPPSAPRWHNAKPAPKRPCLLEQGHCASIGGLALRGLSCRAPACVAEQVWRPRSARSTPIKGCASGRLLLSDATGRVHSLLAKPSGQRARGDDVREVALPACVLECRCLRRPSFRPCVMRHAGNTRNCDEHNLKVFAVMLRGFVDSASIRRTSSARVMHCGRMHGMEGMVLHKCRSRPRADRQCNAG